MKYTRPQLAPQTQSAHFHIEVMRGIPMLVLLFYIAFVAAPALVALVNAVFAPWMDAPMRTRDFPLLRRAVAALSLGLTLCLTPLSRFRNVILPQAFRTISPPWGNDFIAMIKDSALVSALGAAAARTGITLAPESKRAPA